MSDLDFRTVILNSCKDGSVNKEKWDAYYTKHLAPTQPSSFAVECAPLLKPGSVLFELGCGNGRDALFFLRHEIQVFACDSSDTAIAKINETHSGNILTPHRFFCADFTNLPVTPFENEIDAVYSRFTLHAIEEEAATRALTWAKDVLKPGGLLLIEARSVLDPMYGKGTPAGRDAFINDHYRRFLRKDELTQQIEKLGFELVKVVEADHLAVFGADNPVVIRVQARRKVVVD